MVAVIGTKDPVDRRQHCYQCGQLTTCIQIAITTPDAPVHAAIDRLRDPVTQNVPMCWSCASMTRAAQKKTP